jgi:hypothetical protein
VSTSSEDEAYEPPAEHYVSSDEQDDESEVMFSKYKKPNLRTASLAAIPLPMLSTCTMTIFNL